MRWEGMWWHWDGTGIVCRDTAALGRHRDEGCREVATLGSHTGTRWQWGHTEGHGGSGGLRYQRKSCRVQGHTEGCAVTA